MRGGINRLTLEMETDESFGRRRVGHLPQIEAALDERLSLARGWCAREDLNLQPLRDQILSLARLPFRHARILRSECHFAG